MLKLGLLMAAFWLAVDQGSKWWIINRVMDPPRTIPVTGFWNIVLGWNSGVSFGMFGAVSPEILIAVTMAITLFLGFLMWRAATAMESAGLGLIVGGALGNVIDRMRFGAVTDFLDFYLGEWHWPTFNMADVGIVGGAGLLLLSTLLGGKHESAALPDRSGRG